MGNHPQFREIGIWNHRVSAAGSVGTNLDVTPTTGEQIVYEMIISAPFATAAATLKIYRDSAIGGNLIYDGYMANRDANGAIKFQVGQACTTKWIVDVTGGSDALIVEARYK